MGSYNVGTRRAAFLVKKNKKILVLNYEYPLDALREALINAICHRDYTQSSDINIRIYDDELIIWSLGGLPMGITIDDLFKTHNSILRNRLIAQVFYDVGLIERWGSGIKKIVDTCLQFDFPNPIMEERQGFRIIFRKEKVTEKLGEKLGENQKMILNFIKRNGHITIPELSQRVKISTTAIENNIAKLKQKGLLKRIGADKGGYWEVKSMLTKRFTIIFTIVIMKI